MDDLASLDAAVYHSLVQLKTYQGDVADLALDFTWTVERTPPSPTVPVPPRP